MNRKNIESMIPLAVKIIGESGIVHPNKDGIKEIKSEYFGYVDSFGPTVIQGGLLQACAFYSQEDKKADRKNISDIIKKVLLTSGFIPNRFQGDESLSDITEKVMCPPTGPDYVFWRERVLEAAIACKLAIRLFHKDKTKKPEESEGDN